MIDHVVDAVLLVLAVLGSLIALDGLLLLVLWRIRVLNRNMDRREKQKKQKSTLWDKEATASHILTEEEMDRFYGAPW